MFDDKRVYTNAINDTCTLRPKLKDLDVTPYCV